jgi:SAM-dependent methyltransferase
MTSSPATAMTADEMRRKATASAAVLRPLLPPSLAPLFDVSFIHSAMLYDEFVCRLALAVFQAAGLEKALREPGRTEEIAWRAGLELGRARVPLDWILRRLAARGVLEERPGGRPQFRLRDSLPALDPTSVCDEQRQHDPAWMPSYVLAETVARDYPAFLRGERKGEEILFSSARLRLWTDFFSNENRLYAVNNRVGAIAVEQWLPRTAANVLELGGGLGSAAVAVLEALRSAGRLDEIREYRFTEIVPAFLRRGQQTLQARFPEAGFLQFGALDMNHPFDQQGVAPGSLALVYAVNTLHVAHDLRFTLGQIFRALEPGGRLIASECVRPQAGQPIDVEFVFNLMETFRAPLLHPSYRPNGGFLTPEQWTEAVAGADFVDVQWLPDIVRLRSRFPAFSVAAIGATRPS